jgi:hypothetical protein
VLPNSLLMTRPGYTGAERLAQCRATLVHDSAVVVVGWPPWPRSSRSSCGWVKKPGGGSFRHHDRRHGRPFPAQPQRGNTAGIEGEKQGRVLTDRAHQSVRISTPRMHHLCHCVKLLTRWTPRQQNSPPKPPRGFLAWFAKF